MTELRGDQMETVAKLRRSLADHQSVLVQAATGFGKTFLAAYIASGAYRKQSRVVFGVTRIELIKQTSKTFAKWNIPHSFIAAGMPSNPFNYIQIASADTLKSRKHLLKCDLFIPDEARLWAAPTRRLMIQEARANGAKIIGLDATPERMDGTPLADLFDHMVHGPSVEWLMNAGHLSKYRAFAPVTADLGGLHSRGGEYVTDELEERFNKPSVIGDAIAVHKKYARGLRTMAFAFSRKHGRDLTEAYNRAGIPAVYIDGTTGDAMRVACIEAFADRRAEVLVSVNLVVDGFDLSSQVDREVPVEAVSLQRPTKSLPMAMQMIGRALRPKDRPAIILDHVNLLAMHGLPDDDREWSLAGVDRKKREAEAAIATMKCMNCFGTFRSHEFKIVSAGGVANRKCPSCEFLMPASEGRQVEEVAGEIDEIDVEAMRRAKKMEVGRARDLPSLIAVAKERGNKPGWIVHTMKARGQDISYSDVMRAWRG